MMIQQPPGGESAGPLNSQKSAADWKGRIVSQAAGLAQTGGLDTLTEDGKEHLKQHLDRYPAVRDTVWEQEMTRMTSASTFTPVRK